MRLSGEEQVIVNAVNVAAKNAHRCARGVVASASAARRATTAHAGRTAAAHAAPVVDTRVGDPDAGVAAPADAAATMAPAPRMGARRQGKGGGA